MMLMALGLIFFFFRPIPLDVSSFYFSLVVYFYTLIKVSNPARLKRFVLTRYKAVT